MSAGQAGVAFHTVAVLQAYQADVLKELDEGDGLAADAVKELRWLLTWCLGLPSTLPNRSFHGGNGCSEAPSLTDSY